jgi:hypothetical protein
MATRIDRRQLGRGAAASKGVDVTLGKNTKQAFEIRQMATPTALQAAILKDWLRSVQ